MPTRVTMLVCTKTTQYIVKESIIFMKGYCRIFYTHKDGKSEIDDGVVEVKNDEIISIQIYQQYD